MTQPLWVLGLYDVNGNLRADLSMATNRSITYQLNQPAVASFDIPVTHPAAAYTMPGSMYLKAYREYPAGTRSLRFYGPVWADETSTGSGLNSTRVTCMDPLIYLSKRFTSAAFTATDRGSIIKTVVDTANTLNDTGILTDPSYISTSTTLTADYSQEHPTILDLIGQYSDALDGCDTAVVPQELSAGKIGKLYVYARQGSAKTSAIFGYGSATINNCLSMNRTRNAANITNDVYGQGDASYSEWQNATSQNAYRRLVEFISFSGETNEANLSVRTQRYLDTHKDPDAVAEHSVTPGPRAPRLFTDFVVGDTVPLHCSVGGLSYQVNQRVYGVTLSIDEAGREILSNIELRNV